MESTEAAAAAPAPGNTGTTQDLRKALDALVQWVNATGVIKNPALAGINTAPLDDAKLLLQTLSMKDSPAMVAAQVFAAGIATGCPLGEVQ